MAQYPPLLDLDEERESALKAHLDQLLFDHDSEREVFIDELIKMQKDYWAKPVQEKRTFPFTNAANIIIPLTAIVFETVHARTMTTLFGLKQFVSAKSVNPQYEQVVTPFEQYFDHELRNSIKIKDGIESAIIELEKLGTGVASTYYENIVKWGVKEIAGKKQEFPVTVSRGAKVCSTPLSRFLCPYTANSVETAAWSGEEFTKTPYEVKVLEQSGLFYEGTFEALKMWYTHDELGGKKYERSQQQLEKREPTSWVDQTDFVEMWLSYDYDDSGYEKEIVVHYHRTARILMAVRDNWNFDLRRKYRTGVYFPVEHRITGIGISKQNEQFQKEVTVQHRQRLDNATIANMRMFKVSKLSGYGPNEPIFPGKMWFLDDMTQIDTVQLGEVYPSSFNNEQQTLMYSQQRTGVNEVVLGMPQTGTPGTATSDLARVKEGQKKFDYTYGNIKKFTDAIIMDLHLQIAQYGPSSPYYFENINGGSLVQQFLSLPPELIKQSLILEVTTAGEKDNNIIDRQNWMQISQIIQQYVTGMLQLAMQTGDQQAAMLIAKKGMSAGTEALKQILESFEVRNVDKIIIPELLQYGIGPVSQLGGSQGANGTPQGGAMADPSQIAALLGGGGSSGMAGI